MNQLDKDYLELLKDIMTNGVEKDDRTGTGTISVFGRQIRHDMSKGFPLLTTKKIAVKTMMTELKWFLKGDTNIKYLVDNGCNIWNGDAYKRYKEDKLGLAMGPDSFIQRIKTSPKFAEHWGELGPIYGKQWRDWGHGVLENKHLGQIDQIKNLINDLKNNPDSRRLMVSAWNVGELDGMTLPPCHYGFQVYTRELTYQERNSIYTIKFGESVEDTDTELEDTFNDDLDNSGIPSRAVSLMWNQRSVDTFLGLPFNIASYGMLLELIANECNMVADELVGNLGDVHLYKNHTKQAKTQISREPYPLPALTKLESNMLEGEFDYTIEYYESWPKIEAPLSN